MQFGKIRRAKRRPLRKHKIEPAVRETMHAPLEQANETVPAIHDMYFGDHEWMDLAMLVDIETPLGRAVRKAQRFFTDEDLVAAMNGESDMVTLTIIDAEPAFLNAAMISEIMMGSGNDVRPAEFAL